MPSSREDLESSSRLIAIRRVSDPWVNLMPGSSAMMSLSLGFPFRQSYYAIAYHEHLFKFSAPPE